MTFVSIVDHNLVVNGAWWQCKYDEELGKLKASHAVVNDTRRKATGEPQAIIWVFLASNQTVWVIFPGEYDRWLDQRYFNCLHALSWEWRVGGHQVGSERNGNIDFEEDSELEVIFEDYLEGCRDHEHRRLARIKDSRAALALQGKRDRWKAASARYYERHPEVKEKKRVKAAELRAAKKLARRRWDPPKKKQNDTPDPEPEEVCMAVIVSLWG
ncbi:hypothetical protein B0H12DRAFT_1074975 [Mycena haematopus]|nr:hypothetical protein B0H12DRAFT_1074975 [Mycena haematopus]